MVVLKLDESKVALHLGLIIPHYWGKTFLNHLSIALWVMSFSHLVTGNGHSSWHCMSTKHCFLFSEGYLPISNGFSLLYALFITWLNTQGGPSAHLQGPFSVPLSPLQPSPLWSQSMLVSPDSQLHQLCSGSLVDPTSGPSPCAVAWVISQGSELGALDSLHEFSGIIVLHCLRSFVLKIIF